MADQRLYNDIVVKNNRVQSSPVKSRAYRGLSTVGKSVGNTVAYDLELIKQDLINHLHIRQGEKLENPEFGTIVWDLLFEPLTESLKEAVAKNITEIVNYDPRVQVERIVVDEYEAGIIIECELTYLPYNITEQLVFKFDEANGLLD
jgi:phage baseplate assembly protein W|tara:strand:+ start:5353 stop:5793 length:441 start_codon:yes stop_codon:yes gene_type:complete